MSDKNDRETPAANARTGQAQQAQDTILPKPEPPFSRKDRTHAKGLDARLSQGVEAPRVLRTSC